MVARRWGSSLTGGPPNQEGRHRTVGKGTPDRRRPTPGAILPRPRGDARTGIDKGWAPSDGNGLLIDAKTRASCRSIPLSRALAQRLREHLMATGRPGDGSLVFSDPLGRPLSANGQPRTTFLRLIDTAGLGEPRLRLHDLRHAYASHLLAAGLGFKAVADLLGHEDAGLVARRYGHALPDEIASAGERRDRWFAAQQA